MEAKHLHRIQGRCGAHGALDREVLTYSFGYAVSVSRRTVSFSMKFSLIL
jgi:hypothetical protein